MDDVFPAPVAEQQRECQPAVRIARVGVAQEIKNRLQGDRAT
jgi:hypothetical protein